MVLADGVVITYRGLDIQPVGVRHAQVQGGLFPHVMGVVGVSRRVVGVEFVCFPLMRLAGVGGVIRHHSLEVQAFDPRHVEPQRGG